MEANDYQRLALRTEAPGRERDDRLLNAALGLSGEAGEVADTLKKWAFHGHPLDEAALRNELGDVLWYVALAADALGLTLEEIMEANIAKLRRRYPEGFSRERSLERSE
ncbi:nucleoside triphosphate pyrophosphohydrolase family protein [Candidatus Chloroploca asiatica]|uniref:Nucleotide pyrophosphohydrolase n=1 Tax=Candidatus Chloroploca asiatica TaxID=1506545 RepID=A0A2H3KNE3_9CHLR|nr:nucleoside triphosphate pyrophosphohydrolase family protein [Candidatus Chloroploca asiatica]PDV96666.1 nucleotide pyrophosphohydrolase [Candidatus Chloroploca asiatica]